MERSIVAAVLPVLLLAGEVLAHGGGYAPPGPPPPPHQPTGERGQRLPGTGGNLPPGWTPPTDRPDPGTTPEIPSAFHWSRWWLLNREALLDLPGLRRERAKGMVSGSVSPEVLEQQERLREMLREENVALLMEAARAKNPDLASGAIIALGRSRDPKAVPLLLELAAKTDADPTVRESAALALGMIGGKNEAVRDTLLRLLGDASRPTRERAFAALGAGLLKDGSVLPALRDRIRDAKEDRAVAEASLLALGLSGETFVAPLLTAALRSSSGDPRRRAHAAAAFAKLGTPDKQFGRDEGVGVVLAALGDPDEEVRRQAALTLGVLGRSDLDPAHKALVEALTTDRDSLVRAFAAVTLGEIGAVPALSALRKAYRTGDAVVAPHAAIGLALLARAKPDENGEPRGSIRTYLRLQLREHRNPDLLGALMIAAAVAGDASSAPILREFLMGEESPILRGHAAVALAMLGTRTALPDLRRTLETAEDPLLVSEVAYALSLLADHEATKLLVAKLSKGSTDLIRGASAAALGRIRHRSGTSALRRVLNDLREPVIVRAFAAVGLGLLVQESADGPLVGFRAHLDHAMVGGAVAEVLDFF